MADRRYIKNIEIEDAKIFWRNFRGRASEYNAEGQRNFCVFLEDEELAEKLAQDGWNVRFPKNRTEDDSRQPFIQVSVKFDPYPPNINMITASKGTVKLDEGNVGLLDDADIETVDIRIRPYNWTLQDGRSGVKAYVKDMCVTIQEDPFAAKYYKREDQFDDLEDIPFK